MKGVLEDCQQRMKKDNQRLNELEEEMKKKQDKHCNSTIPNEQFQQQLFPQTKIPKSLWRDHRMVPMEM